MSPPACGRDDAHHDQPEEVQLPAQPRFDPRKGERDDPDTVEDADKRGARESTPLIVPARLRGG